MDKELLKIISEFQKYDQLNQSAIGRYADTLISPDDPAGVAFLNYKKQKLEAADALDRPRRFQEFLKRRRDLLDALEKSIIEQGKAVLVKETERAINAELQKMADKAVKFYFKIK